MSFLLRSLYIACSIVFCLWSTPSPTTDTKKKSLKILFILPEFPKFNQTFILNQITGLIDRGHDVYIFARREAGPFMPPEVERYQLLKKTFYRVLPLDALQYDILFAQFGREGRVAVNLRKKGVTGHIVTCFRGDEITKPLPENPQYYTELFSVGDLFLPVCDYFKTLLCDLGCSAEKIVVQHSGIVLEKFPFKPQHMINLHASISCITICRLVEKKGIAYAIKAIGKIHKTYKNITYSIYGDGPEKKNLQELIKKLNLESIIHLKGWLPHEEIGKKLHEHHLFIHPSLTASDGGIEGIPNTVKEAMACGLPVITTSHAGIPELIQDGISGFLVPEKTSGKLSNAIKYLLENTKLWDTIRKKARETIENYFDNDQLNDTLENLFYELLSK